MIEVVTRNFPTLYMVRGNHDSHIVLVVAKSGEHAVQMCIDEGYDWALRQTQVVRIHKNINGECEVVDILEIAGGRGNTKNRARQFDATVQVDGVKPL